MSQFADKFFWFAQPSSILSPADKYFAYLFLGLLVLAVIFALVARFTKHKVNKNLLKRFFSLSLYTALSGLVWFGMRYENTQLLGRRYWAGIVILTAIIWLGFILKYLIFNYGKEKSEFDRELVKSRYLPR